MLSKAAVLPADQIFLDLEDAVSPLEKVPARQNVIDALNGHDYSGKTRVVRVNGVTTQWCLGDLTAVVAGAGAKLDCVMVPKVEDAAQLHFVHHVLTQLEIEHGIEHRIGIEAQIENGRGAMNIREIAQASPRLETLIFGPGDYAAAWALARCDRRDRPRLPGRPLALHPVADLTAARGYGLQAIDGPYPVSRTSTGSARCPCAPGRSATTASGRCTPARSTSLNEVFAPTPGRVRRRPRGCSRRTSTPPRWSARGRYVRGPDDRRGVAEDRRRGRRTRALRPA